MAQESRTLANFHKIVCTDDDVVHLHLQLGAVTAPCGLSTSLNWI